jgi:endonuclease/exonuclease/phosphatase family metal-dependent hydrolase
MGVLCVQVPPRWWWPTTFAGLTLPVAFLLNIGLIGLLLLRRRLLLLGPLAVLVLGWGYGQRGFAVHVPPASTPPPTDATAADTDSSQAPPLRVLSYNVRIFNFYQSLADPHYASSKTQIEWIARHPADVMCLQEYYNQVNRWEKYPFFEVSATLTNVHHWRRYVSVAHRREGQEFGLAIFSKHPILKRGAISFGKLTQNHAQWADIRRPSRDGYPADTIRIYNVHFQSMSLDEGAIVATTQRHAWFDAVGLGLLRRFRDGAVRRSRQADTVAMHIRACPYPVVLCGDFNDVPYSYTYSTFNNFLVNAHQTVGAGIGSTYNGRLPLLRIDNQFATPDRLQPVWLRVHDEIPYSDHFPLDVVYEVKRP